MIGKLDLATLQNLWWLLCSVVGSLFVFLTFVQGGQSMLLTLGHNEDEKNLLVNSLGRKWELTFTTLVLFGGALFAAFPKFYATSFGGAYWVWVFILFTFIIQAVSYEYRSKENNVFGTLTYDIFLLINGVVGVLLIGTAVGTFFTGANFSLNQYNLVSWHHLLRGLEAATNPFNLAFGFFLVFLSRTLGALYLKNNLVHEGLRDRLGRAGFRNLLYSLPFLLYVLGRLAFMDGFSVDAASGAVAVEAGKYLHNLMAMPLLVVFLLAGLTLVIWGVVSNCFADSDKGIWFAGLGTVLIALTLFLIAGYNNTPFYPSLYDPASSLTIHNASSSHYTLTAMTYVALAIPLVLAYVFYFWRKMDIGKLSLADMARELDLY